MRAARTVRLDAPPEAVWALMTAVADQPRWRAGVARVEGAWPEWVEHPRRGPPIRFRVETAAPPGDGGGGMTLALTGRGWTGRYAARLSREGGGTRLAVEETVAPEGLVARAMLRLFVDLGAEIDRWAAEAEAALERRPPEDGAVPSGSRGSSG